LTVPPLPSRPYPSLRCVRRLQGDNESVYILVMPSLRRTLSSPSVRSSPYQTNLSNNANVGPGGRSHGHMPRRSSGSETSGRRVLADIEWWRVVDGQRDADTEHESEERERDQLQGQEPNQLPELTNASGNAVSNDVGVERLSTALPWSTITDSPEVCSHFFPEDDFFFSNHILYSPPLLHRLRHLPLHHVRRSGGGTHWSHRGLLLNPRPKLLKRPMTAPLLFLLLAWQA